MKLVCRSYATEISPGHLAWHIRGNLESIVCVYLILVVCESLRNGLKVISLSRHSLTRFNVSTFIGCKEESR